MAMAVQEGLGSSYDKAFYDSQRNGSLVSARGFFRGFVISSTLPQ